MRGSEGYGERKRREVDIPIEWGVWVRAQSHDPELTAWDEIKSWTLNQLSHPGALCIT